MFYGWKPYVSVAERRRKAEREMARLRKKGYSPAPVALRGRTLATTFWGKAWCNNLESYSDYASRHPRGRTYVGNGSVVDLQVNCGEAKAMVMGSELYQVVVKVSPISRTRWKAICKDCSGSIDSLVELLQGRLSKAIMERVCQQKNGLFPAPAEMDLSCSCPDWASMCKHVAAVLYGIGARIDKQPALIFKLRAVDEGELIAIAATGRTLATNAPSSAKVLEGDDLAALFGLEMEGSTKSALETRTSLKDARRAPRKKSLAPAPALAKTSVNKLLARTDLAKVPEAKGRAGAAGKREVRSKR